MIKQLKPVIDEKELRRLGRALYESSPGRTCSWNSINEKLQAEWIVFARYAYLTSITIWHRRTHEV